MDPASRANRIAWEQAHQERVWANGEMLTEAAAGVTLVASEHALLRDILAARPWWCTRRAATVRTTSHWSMPVPGR